MRIYGPFHMLNNPLIMATLGLHLAGDAAEFAQHIGAQNDAEALKQSLLTGQPVSEVPGGIFRRGLSKLTDGLVSPNASVSAEGQLDQQLALRKQGMENLKGAADIVKLRNEVGPAPFSKGGAFANQAATYAPGLDLTQPTAGDEKTALAKQSLAIKTPGTPEYQAAQKGIVDTSAKKKQAELGVVNSPENQQAAARGAAMRGAATARAEEPIKIDTAVRSASATAPIKVDTAAREQAARLAMTNANAPTATADAANRAVAVQTAKANAADARIANRTPSQLRADPVKGGVFVHKDDLKIAGDKDIPSYAAGLNNSDYSFVPNKFVGNKGGLNDAISTAKELDRELRPLIYNADGTPNYKIFPDTARMSQTAARIAQTWRGINNYQKLKQSPEIQSVQRANSIGARYITGLQGRFPNMKEFGFNLLPDAGGSAAELMGSNGLLGSFVKGVPVHEADSWAVAAKKYQDMRSNIINHWTSTAGVPALGEGGVATDEDDSDITSALKASGATH